jgi:hypothetical protein
MLLETRFVLQLMYCQNLSPQNVQMQVQKYVGKSPRHHQKNRRVQVTIPMAMIMEMAKTGQVEVETIQQVKVENLTTIMEKTLVDHLNDRVYSFPVMIGENP